MKRWKRGLKQGIAYAMILTMMVSTIGMNSMTAWANPASEDSVSENSVDQGKAE